MHFTRKQSHYLNYTRKPTSIATNNNGEKIKQKSYILLMPNRNLSVHREICSASCRRGRD